MSSFDLSRVRRGRWEEGPFDEGGQVGEGIFAELIDEGHATWEKGINDLLSLLGEEEVMERSSHGGSLVVHLLNRGVRGEGVRLGLCRPLRLPDSLSGLLLGLFLLLLFHLILDLGQEGVVETLDQVGVLDISSQVLGSLNDESLPLLLIKTLKILCLEELTVLELLLDFIVFSHDTLGSEDDASEIEKREDLTSLLGSVAIRRSLVTLLFSLLGEEFLLLFLAGYQR